MNRYALSVVAPLVLVAAFAAAAAPPAPTLRSDEEIKRLMSVGQWDDAIAAARDRASASPDDTEAFVLGGTARFLKARATAAPGASPAISAAEADAIEAQLEKAITLAPQRKDVYLGIIDVETAAGRDDRVLAQVKRCAAQFPADPKAATALLEYGFERQTRQDPLAGPIFQAIYQGYPHQPAVVTAYATHVMSTGELDQAVEMLRIANTGSAPNVDMIEAFGDLLSYKLDFDAAAKQYGAAAAMDPTRQGVRLKWAAALHPTDPKASQVLVSPLRGDSKSGVAPSLELGKGGAAGPGRISRCATVFWKALTANPPSANDAYTMAKTFMQYGYGPQALAETQVALALDPAQLESWMLRAELYARVGLDTQALGALDKAGAVLDAGGSATTFSRDEVNAARAAAQSRLGRNEDALASYKRLTDSTRYTYQIALINERLGHVDEARALLEKVAASGTNAAEVEAAKARLERDPYRKKP